MSKSVSLSKNPRAIKALKLAVKLGPTKTKKSLKVLAWQYCLDVVRDVQREQQAMVDFLLTTAQRRDNEIAEVLRGPSRFMVNVTSTKVYLPEYIDFLPKIPEHRLVFVIRRGPLERFGIEDWDFVDNEKSGYYLWVDGQWTKITVAAIRDVRNAGIRNAFFEAIRKQSNPEIGQIKLRSKTEIVTWEFWRNQYYGRLLPGEGD